MTEERVGKRKTQVSFTIRADKEPRHHSGVSSIKYDPTTDRVHSAGRDGVIRTWSVGKGQIRFIHAMEHHTDWVNDIILTSSGKNIMSGSNDCTVKLWNAQKGFCMSTLRTHKDYVRALAYSKEKEMVASAGFDRAIYLWDVNTLTALTATKNTVTTAALTGSKNSIYSLAMSPDGNTLVSGSTEKVLRVWDTRRYIKTMKLKGHSDNVKALILNWDGSQCLSGSSDGTIKLWALGQQQCIQTIRCHTQGVWALAAPESFQFVISGGKDCRLQFTDLRNNNCHSTLIAVESHPILSLCLSPDLTMIWVGTTDSTIRAWPLPQMHGEGYVSDEEYAGQPLMEIEGAPAIKQYSVMSDKRHILTKDTKGHVQLYDALMALKVEDLGPADFDEEVKKRSRSIYVPSWFSVGLHTAMVTIHLAQDENDCLGAWVSAKDVGLIPDDSDQDQKVNYGRLLLQALFEEWKRYSVTDQPPLDPPVNGFFSIAGHTPCVIGEQGGKTMYRFLVRDAGGEAERACLSEAIPQWVAEQIIDDGQPPKFIKILFFLTPHTMNGKSLKKERLFANDFISMRKVMEHVLEKMEEENPQSTTGSVSGAEVPAEERVRLYCLDTLLKPDMDLRTVRHMLWKGPGDLVITYSIIKPERLSL
ncbi:unnamed protein product [Orchesella dallaii]|uniref:WD repeat-containing protein 48 homolog n=1 Tax=Orchesella dallaii TaxID=48710 RepID=A0ABP1RR83_9HEXA